MGKMKKMDIRSQLLRVEAQGSEMFRQMTDMLLMAEPNLEGAFAMIYAVSMVTACMKKAFSLTGAVMNCHYDKIVEEWNDPLDNELYDRLQPYDEYVFELFDKKGKDYEDK